MFNLGIWPVDRSKYPKNRLDNRLLQKYELWKASGEELNWDNVGVE